MGAQLYTYVTKTNTQIRDDFLRGLKNGLIAIGVSNPNIGPNSDYYLLATALGNEMAVDQANAIINADAQMPDTAAGAALDRWLSIFGLSRRPGIPSYGNISAPCSTTTTVVPALSQLTDTVGLRYQVTTGGIYTAVGGILSIPIVAIDVGKATNHVNGDLLKWVTAPAFCSTNTTVGAVGGTDGLTGGFDSEVGVDEPPRNRLLQAMQSPSKGGNSGEVAAWCTQSSPSVQAAFVYPALLGPGTVFAAVCQAPQTSAPFGSTSKNRDIPTTLVNGTIAPYVQGLVPEHAFVCVTTIANEAVDVAILLSLPSAPTASPPGGGGGWLDGSPWPTSISGTTPTTVTSVTSSTVITVNAPTPPIAGVSHVASLSPANWTLYTATVLSYTGTGPYTITLDTPMPFVASGDMLFPQSSNQAAYVAAALQAFSTLGPGEWTSAPSVLSRSFRHPPPAASWPYSLDARFLKQIINAGPEVLDANWIYRSAITPGVPISISVSGTTLTSPPPILFVPGRIGFYQS